MPPHQTLRGIKGEHFGWKICVSTVSKQHCSESLVDIANHPPSAWGILPSQRWIQVLDLGIQETPLKEVESQQQETMPTSVPGPKTEGCSALLGCLALAVSIQAGRVSAGEWDTFSKMSQSRLGTSLTEKKKKPQSASQEGNPVDTSCDGWDASPVHGAVLALQDRARTCFAQEVCPTGNGAELLSAYPAHQLSSGYSQDPPGWKAADSLTGPKGASSNRCSRKCANFVLMEIPQTVSELWGSPLSVRKRHMGYFYLTVLAFLL